MKKKRSKKKSQPIIVTWNMTYGCNLNCRECFQPFDKRKHPSKQVVLKCIDELSKQFNDNCVMKMTGGEVFFIPDFLELIVSYIIKKTKFRLTVTTNFTFPLDEYKKFIRLTNGRLDRFSVSWHNHAFSPENFVNKVKAMRLFMNEAGYEKTLMKVNFVLIPQHFEKILFIKKSLEKFDNIKLHFQHFRVGRYGRKYYQYSNEEMKIIKKLVQDYSPLGYNDARHFQGKKCKAGMVYFVVNPDGEVYTCHEAYELGGDESLGNLTDGSFRPLAEPNYCPFDYCTVPIVALNKVVSTNGV